MKLIIWLWNPWDKYKKTRHNIGFLFLDYLVEKEKFSEFKLESKFKWETSSWNFNWEKTILLKPNTFMNLSWESIKKVIDFYKINTENITVIYDDLSMDFWKLRFRDKWSAWWHNWIKDMIKYLWLEFKRIKIGIWLDNNYEVSDWVLSKFTTEELKDLNNKIFTETYSLIKEKG
jgi:PTH1 family peptidyl-tRNA hydrolase